MSHTPGPWTVTEDSFVRQVEGTPRLYVASMVNIPYRCGGQEEEVANARLIAAAPELLEALWSAENALEEGYEPTVVLRAVRAAIAKATGGAK